MEYTTTLNLEDWRAVLAQAERANVFHTPDYFEAQTAPQVGHELLYLCCHDAGRPVGVIAGYRNTSGYHEGLVEVGTKSGGCPVMIDEYDRRSDADDIKNAFIRQYLERYLGDRQYVFYPCFAMNRSIFDDDIPGCVRQLDSCAFIDLRLDEDVLWKNLKDKGRNMVRAARRKGLTTRIVRDAALFDRFYELYRALRVRLDTGYIAYDELRLKFDRFTGHGLADFWVAFLGEIPIAFNFMWTFKRQLNYVYNASDPDYLNYGPNNLLQWDMICHYRARGYTTYNLWGLRNMHLDEPDALEPDRAVEGYGRFKLSLGPEVIDLVRHIRL